MSIEKRWGWNKYNKFVFLKEVLFGDGERNIVFAVCKDSEEYTQQTAKLRSPLPNKTFLEKETYCIYSSPISLQLVWLQWLLMSTNVSVAMFGVH